MTIFSSSVTLYFLTALLCSSYHCAKGYNMDQISKFHCHTTNLVPNDHLEPSF